MAVAPKRIRGSGCIYASEIGATGQPTNIEELGEAPNLTINLEEETIEDRNTCVPGSPVAVRETLRLTTGVDITLKDFRGKNLSRMMFGTTAEVTTSTIDANSPVTWAAPNGTAFEVGKMYRLPNNYVNVGDLVFKDVATPSPNTLTANTHYTLDKIRGTFKLISTAGLTSPVLSSLKISGAVNQANVDAEKVEVTGFATGQANPIYIMLDGKFEFEGDIYRGVLELYKVRLSPSGGIAWKAVDSFAETTMSGVALNLDEATADPVFGNVGRMTWIGKVA